MSAPSLRPIQLCLELRARPSRRRTSGQARPYWDYVDLADVGGALRARRHSVRVLLDTTKRTDSTWIGRYGLLVSRDGASGATKAQATRQDALASAAYGVAEYCTAILDRKPANPTCDVRAAAEVMRWLQLLDLL